MGVQFSRFSAELIFLLTFALLCITLNSYLDIFFKAPYVRTQAGLACVLVGSVPLHPEFFDELLLSRNIHSFKLFLIELFDDQLYR